MVVAERTVIEFLSKGASYGEPRSVVVSIETHCSIAFLIRDRAYKLKRPIVFSALDYSTVEKRKAACEAELELNRRTAPELYLGVHAICRRPDGELCFDGPGDIVDWVVAMRRFDQADLLESVAESGLLDSGVIISLATEIADFHQRIECVPGFGGALCLRTAVERNHRDLETVETVLGAGRIRSLSEASRAALDRVSDVLDRRRDHGRVRWCHGDLRLANICLLDGRATLFDAIEFSQEISCIDVLYDLAFLLSDLYQRRLELLANTLFNRYVDATGDEDDLAVLPLMISIRTATRAYSLAAGAQRKNHVERARHFESAARSHLALAASLLVPQSARLIAIGGLDGMAKTAFAYALAAAFTSAPGARVLRGDVVRRRMLNLKPDTRLPHGAYDASTTERVYAALIAEGEGLAAAGVTVAVVTDFYRPAHRAAVAAAASRASVPFTGLWLGDDRDLRSERDSSLAEWQTIETHPPRDAWTVAQRIAREVLNR